jgi:hypothetical protein
VLIFPNPVEDLAHLQIEGNENPKSISMYSVEHRLIKKMPYGSTIDLSDLDSGIYLIVLEYKNHKGFTRISKK